MTDQPSPSNERLPTVLQLEEEGNNMTKDYSPIDGEISLHGLGFIQIKMTDDRRMHIWHPDLPRRKCFQHSPIHNHRFGFISTVLKGTQINQRAQVISESDGFGTHRYVNHDGPRSPKGGRESFLEGECCLIASPSERYSPGDSYEMAPHEYHQTPNSGIVITVMKKLVVTKVHAKTIIRKGHEFDQQFDRFQLSPDALWAFVRRAFEE